MIKNLVILSSIFITSSCSIFNLGKEQAEQIKKLENHYYVGSLEEISAQLFEALDRKRSFGEAPLIVKPHNPDKLNADFSTSEKISNEGFSYQNKIYLPKELEFGPNDLLSFSGKNLKDKVMDSIFKGKYHTLKKTDSEIVIIDQNVLYTLTKTKDGISLRSQKLFGIARGPIKLDLELTNLLDGKLPFSFSKGPILLEASLKQYGERDTYSELEMYYLLTRDKDPATSSQENDNTLETDID